MKTIKMPDLVIQGLVVNEVGSWILVKNKGAYQYSTEQKDMKEMITELIILNRPVLGNTIGHMSFYKHNMVRYRVVEGTGWEHASYNVFFEDLAEPINTVSKPDERVMVELYNECKLKVTNPNEPKWDNCNAPIEFGYIVVTETKYKSEEQQVETITRINPGFEAPSVTYILNEDGIGLVLIPYAGEPYQLIDQKVCDLTFNAVHDCIERGMFPAVTAFPDHKPLGVIDLKSYGFVTYRVSQERCYPAVSFDHKPLSFPVRIVNDKEKDIMELEKTYQLVKNMLDKEPSLSGKTRFSPYLFGGYVSMNTTDQEQWDKMMEDAKEEKLKNGFIDYNVFVNGGAPFVAVQLPKSLENIPNVKQAIATMIRSDHRKPLMDILFEDSTGTDWMWISNGGVPVDTTLIQRLPMSFAGNTQPMTAHPNSNAVWGQVSMAEAFNGSLQEPLVPQNDYQPMVNSNQPNNHQIASLYYGLQENLVDMEDPYSISALLSNHQLNSQQVWAGMQNVALNEIKAREEKPKLLTLGMTRNSQTTGRIKDKSKLPLMARNIISGRAKFTIVRNFDSLNECHVLRDTHNHGTLTITLLNGIALSTVLDQLNNASSLMLIGNNKLTIGTPHFHISAMTTFHLSDVELTNGCGPLNFQGNNTLKYVTLNSGNYSSVTLG